VLTVLAAVALWPIRWLRWPATVWATLIVVSTVTTGIHYTIDVLGGLGLAVTAHAGAKVLCRDQPLAWLKSLGRLSSRCRLPLATTLR
jgi:membrane-associated phospholipid phosphatase